MRVPLSWLREFVDVTISPEQLADRLPNIGLEVAEIAYIGVQPPSDSIWSPDLNVAEPPAHIPWDRNTIFVGEIVSVEQHPNAERLTLPRVRYGDGKELTVVTGAPNIKVGMKGNKVALATKGARLIDGHSETRKWVTLKPSKLRGVESEGMVCSELELGLSDEHEGIIFLPDDAPTGTPLADYWGDVVLVVEATPNYAHALSILGLAREVSALLGTALHPPAINLDMSDTLISDKISVHVEDATICPRFVAGLIEGVTVAPSPMWMQRRLRMAGQRPINNIADVTNYVMLEYGEPSHAFDADQIKDGTLIIRQAHDGEVLETLDHVKRTLRPIDTVVADAAGASSLAGVMGGAASEISDTTVNVLYEAALWHPVGIRRTSQHFRLASEASRRFEKGVDPELPPLTTKRGLQLIQQIAGGTIANGLIDVYPQPFKLREIELAVSEVKRIIGVDLKAYEITALLKKIGFKTEPIYTNRGEALRVTVPSYRTDVEIEADVLEEVARMYGYDRIPETLMADELPPQRANTRYEQTVRLRDMLAASGLSEAISYSLTNPATEQAMYADGRVLKIDDFVQLENPMTPERNVMRRSILPELVRGVAADLRERERVALFEIGAVFHPVVGQLLPDEPQYLTLVLAGARTPSSWQQQEPPLFDFFDVKGIVEEVLRRHGISDVRWTAANDVRLHPGRSANVLVNGETIGVIGELHPLVRSQLELAVNRVAVAELNLDQLLAAAHDQKYTAISRFPATIQDIALLVPDEIAVDQVTNVILKHGGEFIKGVELFDVYTGSSLPAGVRSLAFHVRFSAPDRTLSDKELVKPREKLLKALERELGVKLRN